MPPYQYQFPSRQLVSQAAASIIEPPRLPRSRFLNRWTRKLTFDAGFLVPCMVDEILPGDHMTYTVYPYVRMQTPLFPLYDDMEIIVEAFFCPTRILWANFERFMGAQINPGDAVGFVIPQITMPAGGYAPNNLLDHLTLPTVGQIGAGLSVKPNALQARMYNKVWNTWYRDQNLQDSAIDNIDDGEDDETDFPIRRRCKRHDYFTTCLPWPQKFSAPSVPLSGDSPVTGLAVLTAGRATLPGPVTVTETPGTGVTSYTDHFTSLDADATSKLLMKSGAAGAAAFPSVFAKTSQIGFSINQFRQAFLIQQLLERQARGGTRYIERLKSDFGVISPDFRLQRPEYLGGGTTPLHLTPIAQTAPTTTPLGSLGATATAVGRHTFSYAATEHGFIMVLISARSELSYQQGLQRQFNRRTQYEVYTPALAQLGEQVIPRKEIYVDGNTALDDGVFGYQEPWHDYRTRYSEVTGMFRSTTTPNIDEWHLAQQLAVPALNATFIQESPPLIRVLAAGESANNMQFLGNVLFERNAVRVMPTYGTPANLGRF